MDLLDTEWFLLLIRPESVFADGFLALESPAAFGDDEVW